MSSKSVLLLCSGSPRRLVACWFVVLLLALLCPICSAGEVSLGLVVAGIDDVAQPHDLPKLKRGAVVVATFAGGPVFEQLKLGDVITTIGGKAINDSEGLDAVLANASAAKHLKITFKRPTEEKEWESSTVSVKPVALSTVLASAMEPNTNSDTKVTFYDFKRPIEEYSGKVPMAIYIRTKTNVGLRVLEGDGKYRLALSFCYSGVNWLRLEGITFADDKKPFEIKFGHDLVKHDNNLGTVWEYSTIPLTDDQIAQLKAALKPFGTVRMIGSKEQHEYKLNGIDWAAIQTALAFYDMKTAVN